MTGKSVTDRKLVAELVSFFGPRRAATVLGYCALLGFVGAESRQEIVSAKMAGMVSVESRYRLLLDLRGFRAFMAARGYVGFDADDLDAGEMELVGRLAAARVAAS